MRTFAIAVASVVAAAAVGCSGGGARPSGAAATVAAARVGVDPVPVVHLEENHSESLIAWRRAGVKDRVLIHFDGHSDFDWLPDATIARIAAADPDELPSLELHPYTLDGSTHEKFGIWNWIYPAARLGIVRRFIWVVPDGTLGSPAAAGRLVHDLILDKIQSISLAEAKTLRLENGAVRGTVLGIPWTICELSALENPGEPVLLDVDLDYFTTASAETQEVTARPWTTPSKVVAALRAKGIRADVATVSLSTQGGYLPPACRWIAPEMVAELSRSPDVGAPRFEQREKADALAAEGKTDRAVDLLRELVAKRPGDGPTWYALSKLLARSGHATEAAAARAKAVAADPVLVDATLFEADRLWLNESYGPALDLYRAYERQRPDGPFLAYTLRREAGCLMRTGHDDEAIADFRRVLELAPDHGDTHLDLGVLLRDHGDLDGAIKQLTAARSILPDLGTYAMALGTTYAREGLSGRAIDELEAAVARRPTWAEAQLALAVVLMQAGRTVDARPHVEAVEMLDPGNRILASLRERLPRRARAAVPRTTPVGDRPR